MVDALDSLVAATVKIWLPRDGVVTAEHVDVAHAIWLVRLRVAFLTRAEAEAAMRLRRTG